MGPAAAGTGGEVEPLSDGDGPTMDGSSAGASIPAGPMPEQVEHYQLLRRPDGSLWELGRGAMGITYKAHDLDLQVDVVLKVINPNALVNADARERFLREARAAARLRHSNIATVFRLGEANGVLFYAMEFCDGETVHQLVTRRGSLETKLALEITLQVSNALVVAQELGVVHRDIKPSNLMITGDPAEEFTVKVIDFGLAKLGAPGTAASSDVTIGSGRTGFVGTAHFASPEQLEDKAVDFRSDIYSLGVTLWFMLNGRPLFEGSMTRVVMQHLLERPPLEKLAGLPPGVAEVLEKMLAKSPEDRPESARELRKLLRAALEAQASPPQPIGGSAITPSPGVPDGAGPKLDVWPPVEELVIAGRYRLTNRLPNRGDAFQGLDLQAGGMPFAAYAVPPAFVANGEAYPELEHAVSRLRDRPHPALLAPRFLERSGPGALLGLEWNEGFSLREMRDVRGIIPLSDVVHLARPIAAAIDHAHRLKLGPLALSLDSIAVSLPGADAASTRSRLISAPTAQWENAAVKLTPFAVIDPAAENLTALPIDRLIRVVYELLGGTASGDFVPLTGLTPGGNEMLRQAMDGSRHFASAPEFVAALATMAALRSAATSNVPAAGSSVRFAPPSAAGSQPGLEQGSRLSYAETIRARTAAGAQPVTAPPPRPPDPSPPSLPVTTAKPDNPWLIIGISAGVIVVLGMLGFAATPLVKRLFSKNRTEQTDPKVVPGPPISDPEPFVPTPATPSEADTAFRDARAAQDAAEALSQALRRAEPNNKLIALAEQRQDFDAAQTYRKASEDLEKQIVDAETQYLLAARRLNQLPGEVRDQAFDRLEKDVSSVGVSWRMRVTELIRRDIPAIGPDEIRIRPETRAALTTMQATR
ncbi:MAG: serine/threonine-protein kinase [Chthoniobacteraceae bacterium]